MIKQYTRSWEENVNETTDDKVVALWVVGPKEIVHVESAAKVVFGVVLQQTIKTRNIPLCVNLTITATSHMLS